MPIPVTMGNINDAGGDRLLGSRGIPKRFTLYPMVRRHSVFVDKGLV